MKSGNNLAYRTWGLRDKATLVLLHGFIGDTGDWEAMARELENDLYMVAVDIPGHGQSKDIKIDKENAVENFNRLLTTTLTQLGLNRFSLMGYSLGGRLAMNYALSCPDAIDKLIAESAHPGLEKEEDKESRWQNDLSWSEQFRTEAFEEVLQRWYHQPVFSDLDSRARDSLMKYRCSCHQRGAGRRLADCLEAFSLARQATLWKQLKASSVSLHYLYGSRDLKFKEIAKKLLIEGGAVGVHSIENAGHNLHREQPEAMAKVIKSLFV